MEWQAWTSLGVVVLVVAVLAFSSIGADLVMIGAITLLMTLGILTPEKALAGFANEGVITVAALFVVAAGVRETGALQILVQRFLGQPKTIGVAQARMMFPIAGMSAFMNNTPLVAMMVPIVQDWAKKFRLPASKLMMPLSFATILGGLCTLLGTSTNVIISGLVLRETGKPLHLFDPIWVGLPCALAGLTYILIFSRWLLPDRGGVLTEQSDPRQYTVEMIVDPASPLIGMNIEDAGLRHLVGLYLVEIDRDGEVIAAVSPQEHLRANDRLVFVGVVESVVELQKLRGLKPATDQIFKLDSPRSHRCLIEAVVSDSCPLLNMTIREGRFRTAYNAAVIAVARNGERLGGKIGDIVLRAGDTLLLEAHPGFLDLHRNSRDFFLLSRVEDYTPPHHDRAGVALFILIGMVIVASLDWLSMVNAAMLAGCLMILTRCCTGAVARRSVDWSLLVVIAASLGLGRALQETGAAKSIVDALVGSAGSPWVALVIVYAMTMMFTEVLTNNAAAVLVFPLAMATAKALGVSYLPFVFAIMMAASCGFATPIGYQTNLMVYGPGGYRFSDYLRFGGLLNLVVFAVTVTVVPLMWSFKLPAN